MSEVAYYVWAFRRSRACYDCGACDGVEVDPYASAVSLTKEEFVHFQAGISKKLHDTKYFYLYRKVDDNALASKVMDIVEIGRKAAEEDARKTEAKKARAAELKAKKAEKEAKEKRKLYEQLKADFEK